MSAPENASALSRAGRLACVLGIPATQADKALQQGRIGADLRAAAQRCQVDATTLDRFVSAPGALENHRLDPNRITHAQAAHIPGIAAARVGAVLAGRPYFSMAELASSTALGVTTLEQLFSFKPLVRPDRLAARDVRLQVVPGQYLVPPWREFEDQDPAQGPGFAQGPAAPEAPVRLLLQPEFEATIPPAALKAAFGGRVAPVLRDEQGCLRYLVPGSLDVWFRRAVPPDQARGILESLGLRVRLSRPAIGFYQTDLVRWPDDGDVTAAVLAKAAQAATHAEVVFAEPDEIGFDELGPERVQSVGDFEDASEAPRDWNLTAIAADAAHAITTGRPLVTVLVIDSGLRLDHPDLSAAVRPDWDKLDLNFDLGVAASEMSPAESTVAHGTRVAGVVAGRASSSSSGSRGVAPGCWVLPVKISGSPLSGSYGLRAAAILEALDFVRSGERGVINISWATSGEHIGVREALLEASAKGLAVACSAGNYAQGETQTADRPHFPSAYAFLPGDTDADVAAKRKIRGLCSVAAVDRRGAKASYSYYGAQSVSFCAPGGEPGGAGFGVFLASLPENYAYGAGTSFAAPHVAGALALLLSADPSLGAQQAIDLLRVTASDISAQNPCYAGQLGAGLINVAAALARLPAGAAPASPGQPPAPPVPGPPSAPTVPVGPGAAPAPQGAPAKVNINTADRAALAALPMMGDLTAAAVVADRAANGPFGTIWDLTRAGVDGWAIGQMADWITAGAGFAVGQPPSAPAAPAPAPGVGPPAASLVAINTASAEALAGLSLCGTWTAMKIVAHRDTVGPFARLESLVELRFIDDWTLDQIRHLIAVY